MKHVYFIVGFISILGIGFITYKATLALLSDTAQSTNNSFAAAEVFETPTPTSPPTNTPTPTDIPTPTETPTPTPTPVGIASHLVINEVFEASLNQNEWVEIYNPTGSPVDVSGWKIEDASTEDTFPTVSPIPANGYAVVIGNTSTVSVPGSAITITLGNATIGSGLNDLGDLIRLKTPTNTIVDAMSYGSNTTIFLTPPAAPGATESLVRNPNGVDTDSATDWIIDSSPSIGVGN